MLRAATAGLSAGKSLDALRPWALMVQGRSNHNKATCAPANKLARICYATLRDGEPYGVVERMQKNWSEHRMRCPSGDERLICHRT